MHWNVCIWIKTFIELHKDHRSGNNHEYRHICWRKTEILYQHMELSWVFSVLTSETFVLDICDVRPKNEQLYSHIWANTNHIVFSYLCLRCEAYPVLEIELPSSLVRFLFVLSSSVLHTRFLFGTFLFFQPSIILSF